MKEHFILLLVAVLRLCSAVSGAYPPVYRLEFVYQIESKVWNLDPFDFDDMVGDAIMSLIESKGISGGFSGDSVNCFKPWRIWRNWHCYQVIIHLDAYPIDDEESNALEHMDQEVVDLFQHIQEQNSNKFTLTWITKPHPPFDLVEYNYKVRLLVDPSSDTTINDAIDLVDKTIDKNLKLARIHTTSDSGGISYCDDMTCASVYHERYTGTKGDISALVLNVVEHAIQAANTEHDWFRATFLENDTKQSFEDLQ